MNRTLDRQGMKEFENRILFQMSANDSSTLIDTPAAASSARTGLYYSEEANRIEKFRPYGIPEMAWLTEVKKCFASRPVPAKHAQSGGAATEHLLRLSPQQPSNGEASARATRCRW